MVKKDRRKEMNRFRLILLCASILFVVAMLFDLHGTPRRKAPPVSSAKDDCQSLLLDTSPIYYTNPVIRFSIRQPAGWTVRWTKDVPHLTVTLQSPGGADIKIQVNQMAHMESIGHLKKTLEAQQADLGLNMNIEETVFHGIPAVKRKINLNYSTVTSIDFSQSTNAYHLQLSVPLNYGTNDHNMLYRDVLSTFSPPPLDE